MSTTPTVGATTTATAAVSTIIKRLSARVFLRTDNHHHHHPNGGNPVTVFSLTSRCNNKTTINDQKTKPLLQQQQQQKKLYQKLATSCDWESVIVDQRRQQIIALEATPPLFRFYLPNGNPVSFCAHAALAGVKSLSPIDGDVLFSCSDDNDGNDGHHHHHVAHVTNDSIGLVLPGIPHEQTLIDRRDTIETLLNQLGLTWNDVVSTETTTTTEASLPLINSSVVVPYRYKTLIPLIDATSVLHKAHAPTNPHAFREACDAINSTGVYLYGQSSSPENGSGGSVGERASASPVAWDCRQFPRDSGYPEDPATGIAAAALAASLRRRRRIPGPSL